MAHARLTAETLLRALRRRGPRVRGGAGGRRVRRSKGLRRSSVRCTGSPLACPFYRLLALFCRAESPHLCASLRATPLSPRAFPALHRTTTIPSTGASFGGVRSWEIARTRCCSSSCGQPLPEEARARLTEYTMKNPHGSAGTRSSRPRSARSCATPRRSCRSSRSTPR